MDHQTIRQQLPQLIAGHLPRTLRSFRYRIFDGDPKEFPLGFRVDPNPFKGRVIVNTDKAVIIKTGRTQFAVLDRTLVTAVPVEGTRVIVEPYARRRFDGLRTDIPEKIEERMTDDTAYTITRLVLGSAPAKLPVSVPQCLELQQLIEQLETMPAPDGHRTIRHMLVDARASGFSMIDPTPDNIIRTPPTISFKVVTGKFIGRISARYLRAEDVYAVELYQGDRLVERRNEVYFDMLGEVLEDLIDDDTWRQIRVSPMPKTP